MASISHCRFERLSKQRRNVQGANAAGNRALGHPAQPIIVQRFKYVCQQAGCAFPQAPGPAMIGIGKKTSSCCGHTQPAPGTVTWIPGEYHTLLRVNLGAIRARAVQMRLQPPHPSGSAAHLLPRGEKEI